MIYKSLVSRIILLSLFSLLAFPGITQEEAVADVESGKTLFRNYCGSCHSKDMKTDMTGPALGGVEERWSEYPREELYSWIRNSQQMISEGHPRAVELWDQWKPNVMNSFPNLTDQEMENILAYITYVYTGQDKKDGDGPGEAVVAAEKPDNTPLFIALAVILAVLAIVLARILANLSYMVQVREGDAPARRKTLVEILTSKSIVAFVIFALVVLGGYTTVNNAIMLGRQQGYEPEQPIKFSHATHAGIHKIDCQYCHDGARRSKHSVIPAANTCMNCHSVIKVGSKHGTAELTKIYASVGWDPTSGAYVENYEKMTDEEVEQLYKKWISDTYLQSDDAKPDRVAEVTNEQWDGIVSALTNPESGDDKLYGPIEWVRIHNLPDHAYFNHAQHVTVGQLECQQCHGPVEQMEVVYQHSPLSMGWCINCHRQTEVQFQENEYYKSYARYHEELATGERDRVTVEDIGGIECQKCHY